MFSSSLTCVRDFDEVFPEVSYFSPRAVSRQKATEAGERETGDSAFPEVMNLDLNRQRLLASTLLVVAACATGPSIQQGDLNCGESRNLVAFSSPTDLALISRNVAYVYTKAGLEQGCSGVLVAPSILLTAAHCVEENKGGIYRVIPPADRMSRLVDVCRGLTATFLRSSNAVPDDRISFPCQKIIEYREVDNLDYMFVLLGPNEQELTPGIVLNWVETSTEAFDQIDATVLSHANSQRLQRSEGRALLAPGPPSDYPHYTSEWQSIIKHSMSTDGESSGAPIFDKQNRLVGIHIAGECSKYGYGLGIPIRALAVRSRQIDNVAQMTPYWRELGVFSDIVAKKILQSRWALNGRFGLGRSVDERSRIDVDLAVGYRFFSADWGLTPHLLFGVLELSDPEDETDPALIKMGVRFDAEYYTFTSGYHIVLNAGLGWSHAVRRSTDQHRNELWVEWGTALCTSSPGICFGFSVLWPTGEAAAIFADVRFRNPIRWLRRLFVGEGRL